MCRKFIGCIWQHCRPQRERERESEISEGPGGLGLEGNIAIYCRDSCRKNCFFGNSWEEGEWDIVHLYNNPDSNVCVKCVNLCARARVLLYVRVSAYSEWVWMDGWVWLDDCYSACVRLPLWMMSMLYIRLSVLSHCFIVQNRSKNMYHIERTVPENKLIQVVF